MNIIRWWECSIHSARFNTKATTTKRRPILCLRLSSRSQWTNYFVVRTWFASTWQTFNIWYILSHPCLPLHFVVAFFTTINLESSFISTENRRYYVESGWEKTCSSSSSHTLAYTHLQFHYFLCFVLFMIILYVSRLTSNLAKHIPAAFYLYYTSFVAVWWPVSIYLTHFEQLTEAYANGACISNARINFQGNRNIMRF